MKDHRVFGHGFIAFASIRQVNKKLLKSIFMNTLIDLIYLWQGITIINLPEEKNN